MTTTSTPELMPDEIWTIHEGYAYSDDGKCFYTGNQINPDDVSYTRTDLYTAACAERDALLALCEGMAGALEGAKHRLEGAGMLGGMTDPVAYQLAAYEKHKGVG